MDAPETRATTARRAADPATTASRHTTTTHAARPTTGGRRTGDADDADDADDAGDTPGEGPEGVDPRFAEYRRSRDRALRNTLIEDHRWLAIHCARRFDHKGEPLDDLVQVALVGVLKAVERYDPTFGTRFSTFAVPTVTGELRRHFRDRTWSVHVPRRAKELYQTVSSLVEDLHQSLGRSPTVPEIAARAGVTVEEALQALEVSACYRGVPLAPPGDDEPLDGPTLGEDDGGYRAAEARVTVGKLLAGLPTDRERQIIRLRFVDGLTQTQIADEVGVSQVQVSRLLRASLDRMRDELLADSRP